MANPAGVGRPREFELEDAARDAMARRNWPEVRQRLRAARMAGGAVRSGLAGSALAAGTVQRRRARRGLDFA